MTDNGIYCTNAQVLKKAGLYASSYAVVEAYVNDYIKQAEGVINATCRHVFASTSAAFTALPNLARDILSDAASNLAATYVINYDMSGYTSRAEAQIMLNTLMTNYNRNINELKDKKVQDYIIGT